QERAAERADGAVELRRLRALEIGKEPPSPRFDVLLEDALVAAARRRKLAACESRHYFAKRRNMILRLVIAVGAHDVEVCQIGAQPGQRPLIQEPGQIVRAVWHQFAAADADEQLEEFPLDLLGLGAARRLRERGTREPERARVDPQARDLFEQPAIRRAT